MPGVQVNLQPLVLRGDQLPNRIGGIGLSPDESIIAVGE